MERTYRKPNRLPEFDYEIEGCYFITLCTHNRTHLFQMEPAVGNGLCAVPYRSTANHIIHKWIQETEQKFTNISIDIYVIMPDHIHLIVTIKERHTGRSLPDVIQFFKTMTTNAYIRCVKNGLLPAFDRKIWQKSYYDHVIRNQQDYYETWKYIENNPSKWMLTHGDQS